MKIDLNKLKATAKQDSGYWKEARERSADRSGQRLSLQIAFRVMDHLASVGMSQKDLAMVMGISPQQMSRMLKGKTNFTLETIARLENATGMSLLEVPKSSESAANTSRTRYTFQQRVSDVAKECYSSLGFMDSTGKLISNNIPQLA